MAETYAGQDPIDVISRYCDSISLPRFLKETFIEDVRKWYKNSGPKYTVERLKFVKQCCVNYYANGELPPSDAKIWFRRNKAGFLYGNWSSIMKLMIHQPQDIMKLLMTYTVFATNELPNEEQIRDFVEAITKPFSGDPVVLNEMEFYLLRDSKAILRHYLPKEKKYLVYRDVEVPKQYVQHARLNNESHKTNVFKHALDLLYQPEVLNRIVHMPWVSEVFGHQLDFGFDNDNPNRGVCNWIPTVVGNVHWINEPGLKERIVTDFHKPFEHLTFPLGKRLYDIVKYLPWDSTFDEEKGYAIIQKALQDGKRAYSFDQSKATDRFPMKLQKRVLQSLDLGPNYRDQMELLLMLTQQSVKLPDGSLAKWSVGQPMGAYPSFAMFTLTHGMVLMYYLYSKGEEYNGQFVIHGDDITILDDELAEFYEILMEYLGVEINLFKSVISDKVAEFNSRLITKKGFIFMRKCRPVTLSSIMDQVTYWGPKCIQWLQVGPRMKEIVERILSIPYVLPNGSSINPKGLSAVARIMRTPTDVLNLILNKESKALDYKSYRQLALINLRDNCDFYIRRRVELGDSHYVDGHFRFDEYDSAYGYAMLQMHLASLDYADSLDKGILEDVQSFIEYFDMDNANVNALSSASVSLTGDEGPAYGDMNVAQTMFETLGFIQKNWNDTFGHEYNYDVSLRDIRSYTAKNNEPRTSRNSKLFKAIKIYARESSQYKLRTEIRNQPA